MGTNLHSPTPSKLSDSGKKAAPSLLTTHTVDISNAFGLIAMALTSWKYICFELLCWLEWLP
jgi:hypothetical protein